MCYAEVYFIVINKLFQHLPPFTDTTLCGSPVRHKTVSFSSGLSANHTAIFLNTSNAGQKLHK